MTLFLQIDEITSDDELSRRVRAALVGQHVPALRRVSVAIHDGAVRLAGNVPSFHVKQLLQHTVRLVAGDRRVIDEVRVLPPTRLGDLLRPRRAATAGVLLLLTVALTGCSQSEPGQRVVHPVSGRVVLNGQVAAGALVVLHSQHTGEFPAPRARTDSQGRFHLSTYTASDGAPIGLYTITVELRSLIQQGTEYVRGPHLIPPQYNDPKSSRLTVQVAEGDNDLPIRLTR